MADLTVAGAFTGGGGVPETGLTLADIDIYLTEQDRATGVDTVIWNGTQHPTEEIDNTGYYIRIYALADLDANNYFARFTYTGAVVLDVDHVLGSIGLAELPIGTAVEWTYTVLNADTGLPIEGVTVDISTDIAGNNVIWAGETDAFGVARSDGLYLPRLDPGTYYIWRQLSGYAFTNPDTEVVA